MGALDAEGVYIYDETDDASPFSDLLNLLGESVSDQLAIITAALALLGGPFRMAIGTVTPTITAGTSTATATITPPVGRFTVSPLVLAAPSSSGFGAFCAAAMSTTTGTLRVSTPSNVGVNTAVPCVWVAFQMTSGSATG